MASGNDPGRIADDDSAGRHITRHDGARANQAVGTEVQARQHRGASTHHCTVAHRNTTAQCGTRRDVHAIAKHALMVYRRAVIDDAGLTQFGLRGDNGLRQHLAPRAKGGRGAN